MTVTQRPAREPEVLQRSLTLPGRVWGWGGQTLALARQHYRQWIRVLMRLMPDRYALAACPKIPGKVSTVRCLLSLTQNGPTLGQ